MNLEKELQILVSIILVNYNGADILPSCLNSLNKFIPKDNCEIILVDNHSEDGSVDFVSKNFPEIKVLRLCKNYGFGTGNNAGAKIAQGKFLFLLNTDVLFDSNVLTHLIELMQKRLDVGIIGTKLVFPDGSFQISFAQAIGIKGEFISKIYGKYPKNQSKLNWGKQDYAVSQEVDWVTGASLFIRAELFQSLGGFDENFFMYFEDSDLCQRARNQGYKILYTQQVSLIHIRGHSMKKSADAMAVEYRRSQIYYYQKHRPIWERFILKVYLLFKFSYQFLKTRNPNNLKILNLLFAFR